INTFTPVGEIAIGGVIGTPTSLVRWGTNGLAFRTNGDQLFLVQTALIPSPDPVPDPTPTPSPTPTPTPAPVEASVRHVPLVTQTAGLQFSLGTAPGNPISDGFFSASDLAAMPGSPGTVAVCRIAGSSNPTTSLSVYDDGVKRLNDSNGVGREIEFSSSPTRI